MLLSVPNANCSDNRKSPQEKDHINHMNQMTAINILKECEFHRIHNHNDLIVQPKVGLGLGKPTYDQAQD